jgi:hypothetical protein
MRARSWSGLATASVMALLLLPGVASAQTSTLVADNPGTDCVAPVPDSVVVGDIGTTVDVTGDAEIDKLTMSSDYGADVVDANFQNDGHDATVVTSADVSVYIVWSCAPSNGEPVQRNDGSDV